MNNGVLIFGILLTSAMAFVAGVGHGERNAASREPKTDDWNLTKTGSMNVANAVVGAWLKADGQVVMFKQPTNGPGGIWVLDRGPIELSNGTGTILAISVRKVHENRVLR